jgi:HAD superfamily phosphoserine phosphatase-like hydrolase
MILGASQTQAIERNDVSIVISDIEGTLTTGSSWRALRRYFKENFNAWKYNLFFAHWIPLYLLIQLNLISKRTAMVGWMQDEIRLFRGLSPGKFEHMAEWIVRTEMWPKRRVGVLSELDKYRQNGVQIVVISSAYQPIVEAFANRLDAIPIGSPLVYKNGMVSGVRLPINAYEHKAESVRAMFPDSEILAAYGDTASDIPMMAISQAPVAVYPDNELRSMAESKGWRIIN